MAKNRNRSTQQKSGEEGSEGGDTDHTDDVEGEEPDDIEAEGQTNGESVDDELTDEPPVGMVRRNANDAVGWVAKVKGHVVYGVLIGRFSRADLDEAGKVRYFYQLKLLRPCKVALPSDEQTDDVKEKDAKKGEIVNLDENKGLEGLKDALQEGGTQVAWVKFKGKKRQQKDRRKTFWDIDAFTQKRNAPF